METNSALKHFRFSDKIPSKYLTFKILGYHDYKSNLAIISLLCKQSYALLHNPDSLPIISQQMPSLKEEERRYKHKLAKDNTQFTSEAVNISLSYVDQQFNEAQNIVRLNYDTILLSFQEQSILLAFSITRKHVKSIFETQLALRNEINAKQQMRAEKKGNMFSRLLGGLKKKNQGIATYGIEVLRKINSRFQTAVIAKLTDIPTLLIINYTNAFQPQVMQKYDIENVSVRSLMQLQPTRPFILLQDEDFTLYLYKFNKGSMSKVNAFYSLGNSQAQNKKLHFLFQSDVTSQSLTQLETDLFTSHYHPSNNVMVAYLHLKCYIVIINLTTYQMQPFKTIDTISPSCVVDLNIDIFLIISETREQRIFDKHTFKEIFHFMGSSVTIQEVVKMDRTIGDNRMVPVLLYNKAMRQVIWSLDKFNREFQILSIIKLNYPLTCMTYIGDVEEYKMLFIGGFNRGNILAFIYVNP